MKLVFATNNKHKLEEISHLLEGEAEIGSLAEIGCQEDIPEDHDTLEENALQKPDTSKNITGTTVLRMIRGLKSKHWISVPVYILPAMPVLQKILSKT